MNDARFRLIQCFGSVFPSLNPEQVQTAAAVSTESWDSLNTAVLMAVVEEDFGIEVGLNELDEFVSFESILGLLERRSSVSECARSLEAANRERDRQRLLA